MFRKRDRVALAVPTALLVIAVIGVPVMVLGPNGLPRHRRLAAQLRAQQEENRRLTREVLRLHGARRARRPRRVAEAARARGGAARAALARLSRTARPRTGRVPRPGA